MKMSSKNYLDVGKQPMKIQEQGRNEKHTRRLPLYYKKYDGKEKPQEHYPTSVTNGIYIMVYICCKTA